MKIDDASLDCTKSELELFKIHRTQTSIEESRFIPKYSKTALTHGAPIEFDIVVSDNEYIDLNDTILYLRAKILDGNGNNLLAPVGEAEIPDKSMVYPVSNFIGSAFSQVEVKINNTTVSSNDGLYAYRSYMESTLSYGQDYKDHQLEASMYHRDVSQMDEHGANLLKETKNKGAEIRFERTKYSSSFECIGPIHVDLFEQPKLILSGCTITLILKRNDEKFLLMSKLAGEKYKVIIEEAVLNVCVKRIANHVRLAHEETLLTMNAKYPLRKVSMKFFSKNANTSDISEPNLIRGILPRRITIGLVSTEAFSGHQHKNPFNFRNFGVTRLELQKNGSQVPYAPLALNYGSNQFLMAYFTMMHSTNMWRSDKSNAIKPLDDYKDGYTFYVFNLVPDQSDGNCFSLQEEGHVSLKIQLGAELNESITIVCYIEHDAVMEIDKNREVHFNG